MFFCTSACCVEAVELTLPGSKGHQDSTLSQHKEKETDNITHTVIKRRIGCNLCKCSPITSCYLLLMLKNSLPCIPEEHAYYCTIQSKKDCWVCLTWGPQRVYFSDKEEAVYLAKVDDNGAHRAVHSINCVARVKCPHFLHPLERQQAAMINKIVTYSRNSHNY